MRQVWIEKVSVSEPLMKCRNRINDIETGITGLSRDEPGGRLFTAQVVSGTKAARARSWLWYGTWEPVAPMRCPVGCGRPATRGRSPSSGNCEG